VPRSPTWTPRPTLVPDEAPHPVVLSIEDAEREVSNWALPANDPRIERTLYTTVADLTATFPSGRGGWNLGDTQSGDFIDDEGTVLEPYDDQGAAMPPDVVLILVEASQRGIDLVLAPTEYDVRPGGCKSVGSQARRRFLAVFDATRGSYIGSDLFLEPGDWDWVDRLAGRPVPEILSMPSPTPRASPTPDLRPGRGSIPTPGLPPDSVMADPLQPGEVPAPLVDAVREMGEVPGSRWVYRVTELWQGVHWSQTVVTETIETALRLAPDVLTIRRRQCTAPRENPFTGVRESGGCVDLDRYFVFPNGRVHADKMWYRGTAKLADMRSLLDLPPKQIPNGSEITTSMRLPLRANEDYGGGELHWSTEGQASVEVPLGRFDGCYAIRAVGDMMNSPTHWTCPGVGVVRSERSGCYTWGGGFKLYELLDFDIPPIVPVP
jgi:hypothetical protein